MIRATRGVLRATGSTSRLLSGTKASAAAFSDDDDVRSMILEKAISHVEAHGWSEKALAQAAVDVGLPPLSHRIVERGPAEMVEVFMKSKRAHVNRLLAGPMGKAKDGEDEVVEAEVVNDGEKEVRERCLLYRAIDAHMEYIAPHAASWPSALALMLGPEQLTYSAELAADLSSDLVEYAGLQPTRSDWYTDRAILFSIYSSTQLFMLSDRSEHNADTKRFLGEAVDKYHEVKAKGLDPSTIMSGAMWGLQSIMTTVGNQAMTQREAWGQQR